VVPSTVLLSVDLLGADFKFAGAANAGHCRPRKVGPHLICPVGGTASRGPLAESSSSSASAAARCAAGFDPATNGSDANDAPRAQRIMTC
jgi:hypothetical protein